ncbi:MAG: aldehyde dehydrogenase family protein [Acidobacteriota bacterium]
MAAPLESPADVAPPADRVRRAAEAWARVPLRRRLAVVRCFRDLLAREALALVRAVPDGSRRAASDTLAGELIPLAEACRFLEREAADILRPRRHGRRGRPAWLPGTALELRREPLGVVLILGAANYPLFLPGVQALQALVAGNGVLLKPGRGGRRAALALRDLLWRAGLDPELLEVLPEETAAARAALASGIDRVLLTGSAATGREVLRDLADRLVPATLELSGCDAVFVRPEADAELVAASLCFGVGFNHGATCIAPRRVFVTRRRAADLELALRRQFEAAPFRQAGGDVAEKIRRLIREAVAAGARRVLPRHPDGAGPVLLAAVDPGMAVARADLFAPVLLLLPVDDMEEALRQDDRCPYALGASVFGDVGPARALAARVQAGVVVVNDVIVPTADPRLPFGGRRESGFGVTRGAEGLREMTAIKAVAVRSPRRRRHLDAPRAGDGPLFEAWLRAAHAVGWLDRARGFRDLILAALRHGRSPIGEEEVQR